MGTEFLITKNSIRRFAENIDMNYDNKIGEMRSIIKNWRYRFISHLGRACVAKTLVLSKLSHLAFVLPGIGKKSLKNRVRNIFVHTGRQRESC